MQINIGTILLVVGALWTASEVMLVLFRRSNASGKSQDSGSLVWLNAVIYGSIATSIFIRFSGFGGIPGVGPTLAWIGLFMIFLGFAIRWTAILTLRQYFTVNVAIQPGHRIIRKGVYGVIRHPAYLGTIVSLTGLGLALTNWITFPLLLVSSTGAFIKRIQIEEQALRQEFGSEYDEYCRATWRLIPLIY